MRLPDGARSRALLIGTAANRHLDPVPAAGNNVASLRRALALHAGLDGCETLTDPEDLSVVGAAVERAAAEAEDLLLVYFSGHGLVDDAGMLHLALPQTSRELLPWSGIPFALLHKAVQTSRAEAKVIILDSCFSGIATQVLADRESLILGQIRVSGHVTLTSSPANSVSYAFEDETHTAFTQALLDVFEHGSAAAGGLLTLDDIFLELDRLAVERDLPRPQKCVTHTADKLALAANRHRPAEPVGAPPPETVAPQPDPIEPESHVPAGELISAEEVRDVRFRVVHLVEGYDEDEVDAFLDRVVLALLEPAAGPQRLGADDVRTAEFTTTRMRDGYEMEDVDAFLDRVEAEFERRQAIAVRGDRG
ncbi:hypothetical protein GCM10009830_09700 [Glycomyces endophyticus]|uniref:Cell wall synthesis protein Wag31 n=1 Tax=Glycomyces endophyticus TaxID=480996 RepID=A0ABN2G696_9ACTN